MSHTCHADGCSKFVPPNFLMCGRHWAMVPKPQQLEIIWRHYRPGQEINKRPSAEYIAVMRTTVALVARLEGVQGRLL